MIIIRIYKLTVSLTVSDFVVGYLNANEN